MKKQELLNRKEYVFLKDMIKEGNVLLLTLTGSISYGTNIDTSDIDIRGIIKTPKDVLLGLNSTFGYDDTEETGNTDTVLYTTNHFFNKLRNNNPAFIEILSTREEDILYISPIGRMIKENINLFLTQNIFYSFEGYTLSLLNRLQSYLSMIEKEEDVNKRMIERFELMKYHFNSKYKSFEFGNMEIVEKNKDLLFNINLEEYPLKDLFGLLQEFKSMSDDYEKKKNIKHRRNNKKSPEKLDKHIMHLFRLLLMAKELGSTGKLSTYRPENEREFLLKIRNGYFIENNKLKECFFKELEKLKDELKEIRKTTPLPKNLNWKKMNEFVQEVNLLTLKEN